MRLAPSLLFLVLVLPAVCHAWGGEGHQLIALIAEEHLTPAARAAVKDLLDGANISDAEVANWADEVLRERRETAPWHYVNIPVDDPKGFNRARDGRDGHNVIDAIDRQTKLLADKTQPREKRVEALKFVVHFIGAAGASASRPTATPTMRGFSTLSTIWPSPTAAAAVWPASSWRTARFPATAEARAKSDEGS